MKGRLVAISLAGWLVGGVAFAELPNDRDVAKALQVKGLKLLDDGEAAAALEKFTTAYALVPSPRILFNMGRAHFELGHAADAYECFDRFLAEAENVPPKSRAEAELIRSQLRPSVALLQVAGPSEAMVSIDGRPRGKLPLDRPLAVAPGTRTVTVRKDEKLVSEKSLYLAEATTTRLVVEVAPEAAPSPSPAPPAPAPTPTPPAGAPPVPVVSAPPPVGLLSTDLAPPSNRDEQPSILGRWWFWVAATAVVAVGTASLVAATRRSTEYVCPTERTCL